MKAEPNGSTATQPWRSRILLPLRMLVVAIVLGVGAAFWWFSRSAAPLDVDIAQTVAAGDLQVTAQIDDLALGSRVVNVLVRDNAGKPVDVQAVRLHFTMAEMDMGQIETDAQLVGTGHFRAQGSFFTMAGRWQIDVTLLRANQAPMRASFVFAIAAPGESAGPINPLTPDRAALEAGHQLYQANCAVCHGASGDGDGPAALSLNPRPSDFTQHMVPGRHTDGQIFLWIRDGYPRTAMPAWGARLSEEQIWQLVVYVRAFGQDATAQTTVAAQPVAAPTVASTVQPATTPTNLDPLPPLIFVRQGNIWRSDGSGTLPKQLTNLSTDGYAEYPTTSPDGSQIAFIMTTQAPITESTQLPLPIPKTKLSIMRADGSHLRSLWEPERGVLRLTAWAPDGRAVYIGFSDILSAPDAPVTDQLFQVVRVDLATSAQQIVLSDAFDPTLSRDGARMAYLHYDKTYAEFALHVAAPDGSSDRELVSSGAFSDLAAPRFSADGKQLVFTARGGPVTDPQGYPIKTSSRSPIQALLELFEPPIAEAHGAPWDVWVINTDGTGLRRLPAAREDAPMAIFSPDGDQIVMMGAGGIYVMQSDGSNLRKIDPLGDHGGLDWALP